MKTKIPAILTFTAMQHRKKIIILLTCCLTTLFSALAHSQSVTDYCIMGDDRACAYLQNHCNRGDPNACQALLYALCRRGNQEACQKLLGYQGYDQPQLPPSSPQMPESSPLECLSRCTNQWLDWGLGRNGT